MLLGLSFKVRIRPFFFNGLGAFNSITFFTQQNSLSHKLSYCSYSTSPKHPQHLLSLLLQHPTNPHSTQQVHSYIITSGFLLCSFFPPTSYVLLFNTLFRCYSIGPFPLEALKLYNYINKHLLFLPSSVSFDSFTYSFLCQACANSNSSINGIKLHSLTLRVGFGSHVYVQTSLLQMYGACGLLVEANKVFEEMPERNSVTWNVLICGFTKWGQLGLARSVFDRMPGRTVVSWTVMIDGYTRMNQHVEAIIMFREMSNLNDVKPTEITLLAIFPAVSCLGYPRVCELVHAYAEKRGFNACDIRVTNSLLDCYAKCGCITSAARFFQDVCSQRKNLVSWTSMISVYAMYGMGVEAVAYYKNLEKAGLKPNRVTFLSVLNACSHGGLVEEGLEFFEKMVNEHQLVPDIKHYGCLIDMLGRAGRLEEAEKIALEVPVDIANVVIWRTLLGACSFHGNVEMGERVTRKILEMERRYGGDYVLMSNIFSGVGRFSDAERLRQVMDERIASKVPGYSLV